MTYLFASSPNGPSSYLYGRFDAWRYEEKGQNLRNGGQKGRVADDITPALHCQPPDSKLHETHNSLFLSAITS